MIRHVVGWNLVGDSEAERADGFAAVKQALESLVGVVPGLVDLAVDRNGVDIDGNYDLGLVAHFLTEVDLRGYIVHPAHLAAVDVVKAHTSGRFAIDWVVAD